MKKSLFFVSIIALAVLTSCGTAVQPEQVSVNPSPLTVVGNQVEAEITGTFPVKKFAKNAVLTITPVLKYEGGEALAQSVVYVGEKARENGQVVWRCMICGYEYVGEELPDDFICPLCKHPKSDFEKIVK